VTPRQEDTRQDKSTQDKTRAHNTRQEHTRQDKTRQEHTPMVVRHPPPAAPSPVRLLTLLLSCSRVLQHKQRSLQAEQGWISVGPVLPHVGTDNHLLARTASQLSNCHGGHLQQAEQAADGPRVEGVGG
jgi:hypothetical protein